MCITRVTGFIDFDAISKEKKQELRDAMAAKRKQLKTELKSLDQEIARLNRSQVTVTLREVKRS